MANIQILVGSVNGRAEQVAELVAEQLTLLGHNAHINSYAAPADLVRDNDEILLLCHSNTGAGDLPDNILTVFLHLTRDFPRLAGKRYGVINLGDSSYVTFNDAGRMLDAAFADLGAIRIGEPLVLDACGDDNPETLISAWISEWSQNINLGSPS